MLVPRAKCKRAAWRGPPWRNRDRSRPGTEYDDPVQKRRLRLATLTAAALAAVACLSVPLLLTSCRPPAPPPAPLDAAAPARPPLPPPVNPPALPALKVPQGGEWDRLAQLTDELKRTEAAALAQRLREQAWRKADVLFVTDGEWSAGQDLVQAVGEARAAGTRFHGVQVGHAGGSGLHAICDPVHMFRDWAAMEGWRR